MLSLSAMPPLGAVLFPVQFTNGRLPTGAVDKGEKLLQMFSEGSAADTEQNVRHVLGEFFSVFDDYENLFSFFRLAILFLPLEKPFCENAYSHEYSNEYLSSQKGV